MGGQNYQTLLLIRDRPEQSGRDASLVEFLRRTEQYRFKLDARRGVEAYLSGGRPCVLVYVDPGPKDMLGVQAFLKEGFDLLCPNPAAELSCFDVQRGIEAGRLFELTYRCLQNPYDRRHLRLTFKEVDAHQANEPLPVSIKLGPPTDEARRAIVRPEPIGLGPGDAFSFTHPNADGRSLLQTFTVGLLPPFRVDLAGTYFDGLLASERGRLAVLLESSMPPGAPAPAAVELWRLCDESCYRDMLIEGGALRLSSEDDEPTAVSLEMYAGPADHAARWRWDFVMDGRKEMGPPWIESLRRAFRSDIREPRPGITVALTEADSTAEGHWEVAAYAWRKVDYAPREGSWNLIQSLLGKLAAGSDGGADGQASVADLILGPARAAAGYAPNHAYAEQLFMKHLWQSPWPAASDGEWQTRCWREVMMGLVRELTSGDGKLCRPEDRVEFEDVGLDKDESGRYVLTYDAGAGDEAVTRERVYTWRLLLPLGSVIRERRARGLVLGVGRLDADHLAGAGWGGV